MEVQFGGLDSTTPRVRKVSWFLHVFFQGPDTSCPGDACYLKDLTKNRKKDGKKPEKGTTVIEKPRWAEKALAAIPWGIS